ncbi:thioredoxin domain-containing protein [Streptomyces polyrhachis]|uniref:Thioredoxin domain-containing protein n=1 Tax=Streptomyces polyrhachis TaxID=1282885 RepID=A0ABW2GEQ2_9ACTN
MSDSASSVPPAHTTGTGDLTLFYGDLDAPHRLQIFLEMRDRGSHDMAKALLETVRKGADEGRYGVAFHFAAILDDTVGGEGSQRALSALAAASDESQSAFMDYLAALLAAQPFPPGTDSYADPSVLLSVAEKVDGLRSPAFDRKVQDGTYMRWAGESVGAFSSYGTVGTPDFRYDQEQLPVVDINGELVLSPAEFVAQTEK